MIIAYHYDYGHGKAKLAINGQVLGESRHSPPRRLTSHKIIGRHAWKDLYFNGDLAELLIYNRELEPGEFAEATTYLADKYGIALSHD